MITIRHSRGIQGLIHWCKTTRLALLHYYSGEWVTKKVPGVPLTSDGFPKSLGREVYKLRFDTTLQRLVLTLLFSTRALNSGKLPDTSSIEDPSSVTDLPDMSKYTVDFWRDLGYRPSETRVPRGIYFKTFHMTTKSGPSGQALWTSMVDLKVLSGHSDLTEALKVVGGPKFRAIYDCLIPWLPLLPKTLFPVEGTTLRRLSWFPDKENKVRVVAILDYWSQTVLRAFHDYLFRVLRKIPQDFTFNQGGALDFCKDWEEYYSIDLTAATDRFPIQVITQVLRGLLPDYYVKAWEFIMVGLPFGFQGRTVRYAVGNPMGAYSS